MECIKYLRLRLSSFIVRTVRVHTVALRSINARAFVVCAQRTLNILHVLLSLFLWVLFFGAFCKEHDSKQRNQGILENLR